VQPAAAASITPSATAKLAVAEAISVSKRFGPTVALNDVSLTIESGQSHALVGRNGAGKSTLVSIMTGMVAADEGAIHFGGTTAPSLSDRESWRRNVACVYQRSTIIPALTVAENLFINRQSAGSLIAWKSLNRHAANLLEEYGVRVDVSRRAGDLDVETRQMVEIARALSIGARFIILDEPTAQLDGAAAARLFRHMRELQDTGVTFLYISHHLQEIYEVCATVTVLRDARHILTGPAKTISHDQLVEAMTGEARATVSVSSRPGPATEGEPILQVLDLELAGEFRRMNLVVRAGEIVGVAGSGSSGASAFGRALFGLRKADGGQISVAGRPVRSGSVPDAIAAGLGCVPQDRQKEGFVPLLGVGENLTLPIADRLGRFGAINMKTRRTLANALIDRLDIKTAGPDEPAAALSGGNQQKVVMGRALSNDPRVLVLIDPTSGVDVRSKESLLGAVDQSARDGRAIIMVTDDVDDLRRCDRVVVMFRGEVVREVAAGWQESELVAAIEGIGIEQRAD
jgi:simple sugar transport system ATP-binding protein